MSPHLGPSRLATLLAVLATAGLVARGGSEDRADAHVEYVKAADGICREATKVGQAMNQQFQQVLQQGNAAGAAQVIAAYQPAYRKQLDRLSRLTPPAGDEAEAKAVIEALNERADTVAVMARNLPGGDQKQLNTIGQAQRDLSAKAGKLAKAYGFKVCWIA